MPGDDNRFDLMPVHAVRTKPQIRIKPDFYGDGGNFNPLDAGRGPESDFVSTPRGEWPRPTIPEGGTPVSFLREDEYPMDPNAGMPANTEPVKEGATNLPARIDAQVRPKQLIQAEKLGQPFKPGGGRRYVQRSDEPLDPSVIPESKMHVRPTRQGFFGDGMFATRTRRLANANLAGLGLEVSVPTTDPATITAVGASSPLTALASIAMAPIEATMAGLKSRETSLMQQNPGVFQVTIAPYTALRADVEKYYSAMKADPSTVTTNGVPFAAAAGTYKTVLDTALKKLADEAKKAKAKQQVSVAKETIKALPAAVVQTAKTPYGMIVLGVGAAVVAGLFIIRSMQKGR